MGHEWYGSRNNSDVVVSLVRGYIPFAAWEKRTCNSGKNASASLDQGSTAEDGKKERNSKSRKRKRNTPESEQNEQKLSLEDLHVHASRLRHCSKYFDACLSERWAKSSSSRPAGSKPVCLTLDVHTNVKYYKDCFARMYSPWKAIPSVKHCLKLLKVASQISYQELTEACLRYLAAVPWSDAEENRIRRFAESVYYPSDSAADLSARLGLPSSKTERHANLFELTHNVLCKYFKDTMWTYNGGYYYNEHSHSRALFSRAFHKTMAGSCHSLAYSVLHYVNSNVERTISQAQSDVADDAASFEDKDGLQGVCWILKLLLETRSARELVEFIVEQSTLNELLRDGIKQHFCSDYENWQEEWVDTILCIFKEVNQGHLLLKTSTRSKLLEKWGWILEHGSKLEYCGMRKEREIEEVVSTFIMTFPYEQQTEIFSAWVENADVESPATRPPKHYLNLERAHENWIDSLQKNIMSLEPQESAVMRRGACENMGPSNSLATPSSSSSIPAASDPSIYIEEISYTCESPIPHYARSPSPGSVPTSPSTSNQCSF